MILLAEPANWTIGCAYLPWLLCSYWDSHSRRRAEAQYSHGIHYDDGHYAHSQNWSLGRNGYSGGWSIQTPRYGYSTGYSYGGGRRHVYGSRYRSGGRVYEQGYSVGRGHYSGTAYCRRRY